MRNVIVHAYLVGTTSHHAQSRTQRQRACSSSHNAIAACSLVCAASSRMPIQSQRRRAMLYDVCNVMACRALLHNARPRRKKGGGPPFSWTARPRGPFRFVACRGAAADCARPTESRLPSRAPPSSGCCGGRQKASSSGSPPAQPDADAARSPPPAPRRGHLPHGVHVAQCGRPTRTQRCRPRSRGAAEALGHPVPAWCARILLDQRGRRRGPACGNPPPGPGRSVGLRTPRWRVRSPHGRPLPGWRRPRRYRSGARCGAGARHAAAPSTPLRQRRAPHVNRPPHAGVRRAARGARARAGAAVGARGCGKRGAAARSARVA